MYTCRSDLQCHLGTARIGVFFCSHTVPKVLFALNYRILRFWANMSVITNPWSFSAIGYFRDGFWQVLTVVRVHRDPFACVAGLSYICHTAASFRGSHPDPVSQLPAHTSEDLVVTEISKVQLAPDPTAHDQYSPVHEFVDDPETFDVHATQSAPSPSSIYPLAQAGMTTPVQQFDGV